MRNYVQTSLDQYINESKVFTLKRKYAEKPAVVVGTKAPLRTQVLNYVAENVKVSLGDLKKFIIGLNEGKARPAAANMWLKRNAQFFVMENSNGVSYFKLSNLGKRLIKSSERIPVAPVVTAVTAAPTAPSMAQVTNESEDVDEGCGCNKKRPPIKHKQLIERLSDDPEATDYPEDTEEDFGLGDPRYGVDRPRSVEDEVEEDIIEPETDEDYIEDDITADEDIDDEDELNDEDLDEEDNIQSEVDELRSEVEELRAIIDELTGDDEDLEDEENEDLEDEDDGDIDPDDLKDRGDGSFEDETEDLEDDNTEATDFEEDKEIDESADEYANELDDEDEEDNKRPKDKKQRKFDFKDKGRPGIVDVDESLDEIKETPEEKVKRVIENIKAKRAAKLNEAEEEKAEDVGSTPPAEEDELTDKDVSSEPEGDEEEKEEEPTEEKVEITEFIITVDDLDTAMKELEELGINAERVPKEAETTEEMPQEVETPEAPAEETPETAIEDELDLGTETPVEPVKEAAGDEELNLGTEAPVEAPVEDELDLGTEAPAEVPETVAPTTEFEENKLKVPADQWETLKTWLEEKGVNVVEMFGGEIEVEEEPGTMQSDDDTEINFDDLELEDDTKVDTEEKPEDNKPPEEAPATV